MKTCPWGCTAGTQITYTTTLEDTVQRRRRCKSCRKSWNTWEVEMHLVEKLRDAKATIRKLQDELKKTPA